MKNRYLCFRLMTVRLLTFCFTVSRVSGVAKNLVNIFLRVCVLSDVFIMRVKKFGFCS